MRIQLPGEFLKRPRAFLFLLYSLGVLGVGSFVYLPLNNDPPILDVVPMAMLTGAIPPAVVLVSVINSWALIVVVPVYIFEHDPGGR